MRWIVLLLLPLLSFTSYAQADANIIVGKWLKTSKKDLIIEVYKSGDEYLGKIAWIRDNDSVKLKGFQILEGLHYNTADKTWEGGKIYHPKSLSTYKATAKILSDGTLEVLAYKGFKFIGKKKYFRRVE